MDTSVVIWLNRVGAVNARHDLGQDYAKATTLRIGRVIGRLT